jgi:hypothetical protein
MQNKIAKIAGGLSAFAGMTVVFLSSALAQVDYTYSSSYSDGNPVVAIIACCCSLLVFAVWIYVTYWVYNDAKKKNIENPILWAVLTFLFGWIPLLIYLFAIRNKK